MTAHARLLNAMDGLAPQMFDWALRIHARPELGLEEQYASGLLGGALAAARFQVQRGLAGMPTAFVAARRGRAGAGPVLALLAEYDALPGLGHACGHNLIGTAAAGAALALAQVADAWGGEVRVYGTPAEETFGGKVDMVSAGLFGDVDAAMMVHGGDTWLADIRTMALEPLEFTFLGRAAHAAAAPEQGINALDAVLQLFNGVNALRQHVRPDVRMHGIITEGGQAPNVVPDRAQARFYFRAADRAYLNVVLAKVRGIAEGAAAMTGARLEVRRFENGNDNFRSNRVLAERFAAHVGALGAGVVPPEAGEAKGSTDIGNVSQVVPAIHPIFPIGRAPLHGHTVEFAAAAASEAGLNGMLAAARAMALTGLDLLTDADLLGRVQAEFRTGAGK